MTRSIGTHVELEDHGSIVLIRPRTPEATAWLEENTAGTWYCGKLVVEPRYVRDLLWGMLEAFSADYTVH